ncbi:hypothetical protein TRVL_07097 [Trypanosoma vivax]|nr:hypothetical protein TRVL_07097 [Trypanosoma vivax]
MGLLVGRTCGQGQGVVIEKHVAEILIAQRFLVAYIAVLERTTCNRGENASRAIEAARGGKTYCAVDILTNTKACPAWNSSCRRNTPTIAGAKVTKLCLQTLRPVMRTLEREERRVVDRGPGELTAAEREQEKH